MIFMFECIFNQLDLSSWLLELGLLRLALDIYFRPPWIVQRAVLISIGLEMGLAFLEKRADTFSVVTVAGQTQDHPQEEWDLPLTSHMVKHPRLKEVRCLGGTGTLPHQRPTH
jgi:hypothetical protein